MQNRQSLNPSSSKLLRNTPAEDLAGSDGEVNQNMHIYSDALPSIGRGSDSRDNNDDASKISNENNIESYKKELAAGLDAHELNNVNELSLEIEKKIKLISELLAKGKIKTAEFEKNKLSELKRLQTLVNKITESAGATTNKETREKIDALRKELSTGLENHEMNDIEELVAEIANKKKLIADLQAKGKTKTADVEITRLKDMERLMTLSERINLLQGQNNAKETTEIEAWRKELTAGLEELEIKDNDELQAEIIEKKKLITEYQAKGKLKTAELEKVKLEKMERLHRLAQNISSNLKDKAHRHDIADVSHALVVPNVNSNVIDTLTAKLNSLQMPLCSELCLIKLNLYVSLKLLKIDTVKVNNESIVLNDEIEKDKELLKSCLKEEEQDSFISENEIINLNQKIKTNDFSEAKTDIEKILKKIRHFDIQELLRLVKKADEAVECVKNQDVVLLLGGTGTGKSTTVHYLAGSKMIETEVNGLPHIAPIDVKNSALKNVNTSPSAVSETRFITAVPVKFKEVGGVADGGLVLCDTPGFEDTNGPEMDVANGIGVVKAVRGCKSIRPLVLISYMSIGDRFSGLKELAHTLVGIIPNFKDYMKTFTYAFTKFPAKGAEIHKKLEDLINHLTDEEKSDSAFLALFNDMLKKTKRRVNILDPIKKKPSASDFLEELAEADAINHPEEVIHFNTTEKSKAAIQEQLRRHQLTIMSAAKRLHYNLVKYKLDELKSLYETLNQKSIKQVYDECVRYISKNINDIYTNAVAMFNDVIKAKNVLTQNDIERYKKAIEHVKAADDLRESHLGKNVIHSSACLQNIDTQVINLLSIIENIDLVNFDFSDNILKTSLDNLNHLANSFNHVKESIHKASCMLHSKLNLVLESANKCISMHDFTQCANHMTKMKDALHILNSYIDHGAFEKSYQEIKETTIKHLNALVNKAETILDQGKLEDKTFNVLNDIAVILETAKLNLLLQSHIPAAKINEINDNFLNKIQANFEEINKKIMNLFAQNGRENSFQEIEVLMKQLSNMRTISGVESRTSRLYYSTVDMVCGQINQSRKDAEETLIRFTQQKEGVDYNRLARYLAVFKNARWIDDYRPGVYSNLIQNLEEVIIQHIIELKESINHFDLDLENADKIESAYKIILQANQLLPLEQTMPALAQHRANIIECFERKIKDSFEILQNTFNLEKEDLKQERNLLQKLEQLKINCEKLHPAELYLSGQGINSIEDILESIRKISEMLAATELKSSRAIEQETHRLESLNKLTVNYDCMPQSQRQEYLRKIKYQSLQEIEAEIKVIYQQLVKIKSESSKELHAIKQELDRHHKIHDTYVQLLKAKELSSEAKALLGEHGFDNILKLDAEIIQRRRTINECERHESSHLFSKIDAKKAEKALVYLGCCKRILTLKKETDQVRQCLERYLKYYVAYVEKEMNYAFNNTFQYAADTNDHNNDLSKNGYVLADRLQELITLSESYPHVYSFFPNQIVEKWQAKLCSHLIELADEMRKLVEMGDGQNLKIKIKIAKTLNAIDGFIKGKKYIDLYYEYQNIISNYSKEITAQMMNDIRSHNYSAVAATIDNLQQFKEVTNQNFQQLLKRPLQETIDILIDDTKRKVIQLSSHLEKTEVTAILENLKKISNAKQYVFSYIDSETQHKINESLEYVTQSFSSKVFEYLSTIEAVIDSNHFDEAEKKLEAIMLVRSFLGNYCSKEVFDKIDEVQRKVGLAVNKVVDIYTNMEIDQYPFNPPKEIMTKFFEISKCHQRYNQANSKIKESIIRKIKDELTKAKNDCNYNKINQHLIKVEAAIKSLPRELCDILILELNRCREDIDKEKQALEYTMSNTIVSGDVETIKNLINDFKQKGMQNYVCKIEDNIFRQARDYKIKIEDNLVKNEFHSIYNDLYKLISYKVAFEDNVVGIKSFTIEISSLLSKIINNAHLMVINGVVLNDANKISSESITTVEKNFMTLVSLTEMRNTFKNKSYSKEVFPEDYDNKILELIERMNKSFADVQKKCEQCLTALEFSVVKELLSRLRKCDALYRKLHQHAESLLNNSPSSNAICNSIKDIKSYTEIAKSVGLAIKTLKDEVINCDVIGSGAKRNEKQRELFYTELANKVAALKQAKEFYDFNEVTDLINVNTIENECIKALMSKVDKLHDSAEKIIEKHELRREDFDSFNLSYNNLVSFNKFAGNYGIDIEKAIEKIDNKLLKKIQLIENNLLSNQDDINSVAECLINLKTIADNIIAFTSTINKSIDELLKTYRAKQGMVAITRLGVLLNKDVKGIGPAILAEHNCFKGYSISLFNTKTQKHGIKYVLDNMTSDGNDINVPVLAKRYEDFDREYKALIQKHLDPKNLRLEELISNLKLIAGSSSQTSESIEWDAVIQDKIPRLMAHIFALWTLKNADQYFDAQGVDSKESYLLQPHAAQVIAIFRMLGIGDSTPGALMGLLPSRSTVVLNRNLVQIGTGEGKSITLAVTASVLGVLGIDVMCACYSDYLSERDYNEFKSIFDAIGLIDNIHYGTFNKLCERVINERGDIRQLVETIVRNKNVSTTVCNSKKNRPKVLLIDEVDVFFNKDFYGSLYTPQATLKDPTIVNLINMIWSKRKNKINLNHIKATPEFIACCNVFKGWEFLIEEAVKDMLADIKTFETHDYIVQADKIGYKEQDGILFNITYSYKTLFAYYREHELGKITQKSLEENIGIGINCGDFSYAEVPHEFQCIMGVTGTLKTLSEPEKSIVQKVYKINKNTYIPSVYGKNNLIFRENVDIKIENGDDYFNAISLEIDNRIAGKISGAKRAVIVFFETKQRLTEFYNSPAFSNKKDDAQIMTEELSPKEKESYIKRATTSGQITLATKPFVRGTNFVCRDQVVSTNDGVHILGTFLSEEISEETQLKGRTARQGDLGSFSMVLLDKDLEKYLITEADIKEMKNNGTIYSTLNNKRNAFFKEQYANNIKHVVDSNTKHQQSKQLLESIFTNNIKYIREFLGVRNKGASSGNRSRTLCLMDATGSMSHLLQKTKNTVGNMFERAAIVLKQNNIDPNSFEMQFAVYRNYNCKEDKLLQFSPWETKPDNLRAFMEKINVDGGLGAEAIEIGLWHANKEHDNEEINQVILIGDAPANSRHDVVRGRNIYTENYWASTKFAQSTFYQDELNKLKSRHVSVHAFFVAPFAKQNFQEIAAQTSGKCEELDINSPAGAEQLTNLVTETVLRDVGGADKGEKLVEEYRSRFVTKSYKS